MSRSKTAAPHADRAPAENFASLEDDDVAAMTDSGSFSRGCSYFRHGAIIQPSLMGDTISAACQGSEFEPYRVTAKLALAGAKTPSPLEWSCTCPRGGFCKHVVALLLTWIDDPDKFITRPDLGTTLQEMNRETLIAIVARMVNHDPELMRFVELPVVSVEAGKASPNKPSVSAATIRHQVEAALHAPHAQEWGSARRIAQEIETVIELGRSYEKAGAWADAAIVFATIADAIISNYSYFYDQEGDVMVLVADCDQGLTECLDAQDDLPESDRLSSEQREKIIRAIYDIWRYDVINDRGLELSQDGPDVVARLASPEERKRIGEWLETELAEAGTADEWSAKYIRRAVISFQVMLGEQTGLDFEQELGMYQEAELWPDVVALLLDEGRIKEAIGIAARKLSVNFELIGFAEQLFGMGGEHEDEAIELVDARLWESEGKNPQLDMQLLDWLQARYAQQDRPDSMLKIARKRFKLRPGVDTYHAVKEAATMSGQPPETWPARRKELLKTLRDQRFWGSLVEIALVEGDIPAALQAYEQVEKSSTQSNYGWFGGYYAGGELAIRVAEAAEAQHPDDAIRLYRAAAERTIAGRSRPYYQQAAEYLHRVKRLMIANGRDQDWAALINEVRTKNKTLRALREELDNRGLS